MIEFFKIILNHKDAIPAYTTEFITVGDQSETVKALIKYFESGDTDNKQAKEMAEEFLEDSDIAKEELTVIYNVVDEFVEGVLDYFGYIYTFDIADEITINV
jgi:uncharacterized coiled-coil DUF342 family protein